MVNEHHFTKPLVNRVASVSGSRILRLYEAAEFVGLSAKHIRNLERKGEFPERVQLGPKAVGFRLMDLEAWIDSRIEDGGQS